MKLLVITLAFILSLSAHSSDSELLSPFETDMCTMFPEGSKKDPMKWAHCCVKHDLAYWVAGSKIDMNRADKELKKCVTEAGAPKIASLMYAGIRFGHLSPVKNKYRWGWAHDKKRDKYQELSKDEEERALEAVWYIGDIDLQTIIEFVEFRFRHL